MTHILSDNYKVIKKLKKTINKYSVRTGSKPNDNFSLIGYAQGFYIEGVENNHPDRNEKLWEQHFDRTRGVGVYKQPAEVVGYCYWCYSEKRKQIVKLLLKCETYNILYTKNNRIDIKWAIEQINFIWQKAFPRVKLPEIKIITEKFKNVPVDELCCMELMENEFHRIIFHLNSKKVSDRIYGLEQLDKNVDNVHLLYILCLRILTRELSHKVLSSGISLYNNLKPEIQKKINDSIHWLLFEDHWHDNTPMENISAWRYFYNKINNIKENKQI
jgi:hypothetical protein